MNIKKHDLNDLQKLALLAQSTYHAGEIIVEKYLDWEYKSNPVGEATLFVAENENQIVSQYVVIPQKYISGNEIYNGSLSVNTITHPDHRGKGLFTKLAELNYAECKRNAIDFTLGFPNKNSVTGFTGKLKFKLLGNMPLLFSIIRPLNAIRGFILYKKNHGKDLDIEIPLNETHVSKFDLDKDLNKYNSFLREIEKRNLLSTKRSPEFIKWRYLDIPLRKYHLYKVEEDGKIVSVIILRAKNIKGVGCGIVVDLLSKNVNDGIKQIIKEFRKCKLDILVSTVPENSMESMCLSKSGFYKAPEFLMFKKLHVIIRMHSAKLSDSVTDFKKWFLTFGDYDIF